MGTPTQGFAVLEPAVERLTGAPGLLLVTVILVAGLVLGYILKNLAVRVAESTGVDGFVEGTTFERVANSFGTSTVGIIATTFEWSVYAVAVVLCLDILKVEVFEADILAYITGYAPNIVAAFFILVFGAILADKASVLVSERLEGFKMSDLGVVPTIVRYSIIFVAVLMALSQLGVSTTSLHILLGAYLLTVIVVSVVAFRFVLPSAVSGLYILTTDPYGIGDTVRIGDVEGTVQEVDLLTTRVASDGEEHIVPNREVFEQGVSREV